MFTNYISTNYSGPNGRGSFSSFLWHQMATSGCFMHTLTLKKNHELESAFSVTVINFPWCTYCIHLLLHFPSLTVVKSCLCMIMWNMNKHFFSCKKRNAFYILFPATWNPLQDTYQASGWNKILTFYLLVVNDHSIQKPTVFF